jgi:hypothetical protein
MLKGERGSPWRGGVALAVVVAVFALLWSAPAHGQMATAEIVPVRVFAGWLVYRSYTRVDQLVLWNAEPGTRIAVTCATGDARGDALGCVVRRAGRGPSFVEYVIVPASGVIDLSRYVRRARLVPDRPSRRSYVAIEYPSASSDLRLPAVSKYVGFEARRRALPRRNRRCQLHVEGAPRPSDVGCASPCPPPPTLQFSNYCEGAGQLLPLPSFAATSRRARGGGVRLTRLQVSGLPLEPPFSNPAIAVFCRGRGCAFGARFFVAPPGGVLDVSRLGRRRLPPGIVLEVQVIKGNFIGRVQRYEVGRRHLVASSLCLYPTEQQPRACPPG